MAGWKTHTGVAVALPLDNIDTDQLIPARFMSTPRRDGYGRFLLHDLRRDETGAPKPKFPLNAHPMASILIAGANFGSGSSREGAVYALVDAGFRAVFAPGFGDIFAGNAVNNGLLPACIDAEAEASILAQLNHGICDVQIDLGPGHATFGEVTVSFTLDDTWRTKLINGWDDIDLTRRHDQEITAFKQRYVDAAPWAKPMRPTEPAA